MINGIYKESKEDPKYFIYFVSTCDNIIHAEMIDEVGVACVAGDLFKIHMDTGTIELLRNINPEFGFDLTNEGKLRTK